jgi:hypothetical protein
MGTYSVICGRIMSARKESHGRKKDESAWQRETTPETGSSSDQQAEETPRKNEATYADTEASQESVDRNELPDAMLRKLTSR